MDSKPQHQSVSTLTQEELLARGHSHELRRVKGPVALVSTVADVVTGLALVWNPRAHVLDVSRALPPVERVTFEAGGYVWTTISRLGLYVYHLVHSRDEMGDFLAHGFLPLPFFPQGLLTCLSAREWSGQIRIEDSSREQAVAVVPLVCRLLLEATTLLPDLVLEVCEYILRDAMLVGHLRHQLRGAQVPSSGADVLQRVTYIPQEQRRTLALSPSRVMSQMFQFEEIAQEMRPGETHCEIVLPATGCWVQLIYCVTRPCAHGDGLDFSGGPDSAISPIVSSQLTIKGMLRFDFDEDMGWRYEKLAAGMCVPVQPIHSMTWVHPAQAAKNKSTEGSSTLSAFRCEDIRLRLRFRPECIHSDSVCNVLIVKINRLHYPPQGWPLLVLQR